MQYIQGHNRHQTYLSTLEDKVSADNAVRLIDDFVDKLELQKLGFTNSIHKTFFRRCWCCAWLRGMASPTADS